MTTITTPSTAREPLILSPQAELALLARALYRIGYDDGTNNGHLTYRQPGETFLTLSDGLGWNEVRASDVITIDIDGNTVDGNSSPRPPVILHLEFHRARPGANVTVHHHPRFATVWSSAGRIPPAYDQVSAWVPEDEMVLYDDYEGGVRLVEATEAAVRAIGQANYALLRNHGVFIVGDSIAQAYTRAVGFERRCKQAWYAETIGATDALPAKGQQVISNLMESFGGAVPNLWEWAVRREIGLIDPVLS